MASSCDSESRAVGLEHYSLAFDSELDGDNINGHEGVKITVTTPAKIYVNWDCDVICPFDFDIDTYWNRDLINDLRRTCMKNLALSTTSSWRWQLDRLLPLPTLQEIWIYAPPPGDWRLASVETRQFEFNLNEPFMVDFVPLEEGEELEDYCEGLHINSRNLIEEVVRNLATVERLFQHHKQRLAVKHKIMRIEDL